MSTEDVRETESTGSKPADVDYNAKAKIIVLLRGNEKGKLQSEGEEKKGETDDVPPPKDDVTPPQDDVTYLPWEGRDFGIFSGENCLPDDRLKHPDAADMAAFLQKNRAKLHHGDILTTQTTDRGGGMHIVHYNEDVQKFTAILNPDEGGSGYLTLPQEVLKKVTQAMPKYQAIFENDDTRYLNMHVSPQDEFLEEKLGGKVPEDWEFDLHLEEGEVSEAYIKVGASGEWNDFDIHNSSVKSIRAQYDTGDQAEFTVTVELQGDKLEAYKAKYGREREKYGWLHERPSLPDGWRLERGETGSKSGSVHRKWAWVCSGPTHALEGAKTAVREFLAGFTFSLTEPKEDKE